ncbi:MAG: SH3 domain-containing protein [Bacteroidota bacterium]
MKFQHLFALAVLFLPAFSYGIGTYNVGDKLNVLAPKGLILRETAAATGKKILTIDPGAVVTVLKDDFKKTPYSVLEFTGFTIKGYWVKVRTGAGKEGFVFDGYLSSYQIPGNVPNGDDPNDPDGTASLQERYLLLHTKKKGKRIDLSKEGNRYEHYRQLFANGAEVEINTGEGGSQYTIKFNKGVTIEEAYLIGQAMWMENAEGGYKSTFTKGKIEMLSKDQLYAADVENKAGVVILTMSHAD